LIRIKEKYKKEKELLDLNIKDLENKLKSLNREYIENENRLKLIIQNNDAEIVNLITNNMLDKIDLKFLSDGCFLQEDCSKSFVNFK